MAKKTSKTTPKKTSPNGQADAPVVPIGDIRHPAAKRKNNPPAKIAAEGTVPVIAKAEYAYNPHLPPVLRFDQRGGPDALPAILAEAGKRPLTPEEQRLLAEALRKSEPWLEWTGKREKPAFTVDPVALHIHERVSAQAILKVAARQDASKFLFADPEQEYHQAVQFYRHDVDWSNRLVLGDSLQVMSSLARREDLAGKVQMIYMDPPYGIKFASNFQPEVGKRDVKDKQEDLTREPEMVRAYRDTWHLGIHSYLSYLRDRLVVAKELLADTGSIFVQISDENLHRVHHLMDEVFGPDNACAIIQLKKTGGQTSTLLPTVCDYLVWYARNRQSVKYRQPIRRMMPGEGRGTGERYDQAQLASGEIVASSLSSDAGARLLQYVSMSSYRPAKEHERRPIAFEGRTFLPTANATWKTTVAGIERAKHAERLYAGGDTLRYIRFIDDFPANLIGNLWDDVAGSPDKVYVVQTSPTVIERCMLMTTDPGDLVLDPTCGSGTTACVAEQWGRRWITIDTSRVAVAIARQRLLTAKFEQYKTRATRKDSRGQDVPDPSSGFHYKTVPHISLKSIAQNVALDPIFAKHEPLLEAALKTVNAELAAALKKDTSLRTRLSAKLAKKEKDEGKRAVTDADRRRWVLPPDNRDKGAKYTVDPKFAGWYQWEVPFDTDPDWPKPLADAVTEFRAAWRAKMDEVNACIAASAEQEELVDQPEVVRSVTRVSGPFTVEAVQPPEMSLGDVESLGFGGEPDSLDGELPVGTNHQGTDIDVANVAAYLDQMFRFIRADGVRFLNNKQMTWSKLEPLFDGGGATSGFHAEGRWIAVGEQDKDHDGRSNVAVVFGPQYGPVTGPVVVEALRQAHIRGYEHVVIAGFNFDGAAQTAFDNQAHPKVKIHLTHIRPDINPGMDGLLKESVKPGGGQLFTVFGQPAIKVKKDEEGQFTVTLERVVIYNPVTDEVVDTKDTKVAAWFLDSDYDGRTFCITQAFFPDRSAWEKLQKALNGKDGPIDGERFEAFSGTTSLPFPKGKHKCVAVKVIDPRGNEVMAVEKI